MSRLSLHLHVVRVTALFFIPALVLSLLTILFGSGRALAQSEHQLIRRVVVFPLKAESAHAASADEAWWQMREELTRSRRFLVASKQFLVRSDTFQPRGDLEPADVLILGKLLDAHAIITAQLVERRVVVQVYDGGSGQVLWRKSTSLHPSLTVKDQLTTLARRLVADFVASIPYQGFTIVDSMTGQAVFEEGDVKLAQADLGVTTAAQIGDMVQWIRLVSQNSAPVFQGGGALTVLAEGKIIRIDQGIATVEILRAVKLGDIREYTLVRVPREAERLRMEYTVQETTRTTLTAELVAPEANPMEEVAKERRPLVTTLSFVSSLAAFLLLAF